ncbi:hypothetical protein [Sulfuricaulis sp.]|jgi:hypothetical protein|uniref:hypothetical protein n=1 Tax=Sulfuricaulis sp. TaxID=2003553 RepID=UPI00355AC344
MQGNITTALLGSLFLIMALGVPVWARANSDETQLETIKQEIDHGTSSTASSDKVKSLSSQFNVDPSVVEGLRAQKQGWGETTIELAMAQRLTQTDAKTYPTMTDALNKIESLRSQKMGWGKIANSLGFKLGPVVSAASHSRNELKKESRAEKSPGSLKSEKSEKAVSSPKADKIGGPDIDGRPERAARPERVERAH